jgi:predicted phosphoribosyltransferase
MLRFRDRFDGGRLLANHLGEYAGRADVVVMPCRLRAIPVARSLSAALGVRYDAAYATRDVLRSLARCTTILVDDGFDSIDRIREAIIVSRGCGASHVVAAAPLGAPEVSHAIARMADHSVCISKPIPFRSVGFWYDDSVRSAARAVFGGKPARRVQPVR